MARGCVFSPDDAGFAAKACVLDQTVATSLFGEADPGGQIIRVKHLPCTVIGVLGAKEQSPTGQDQDDLHSALRCGPLARRSIRRSLT